MKSFLLPIQSIMRALAITTVFAGVVSAAHGQTDTPPCQPLPADRTITWCYPIDNATFAASAVLEWGWIKDSLPHTAKEYFDGEYYTGPPDIFNGEASRGYDDKIHTLTIVVWDAKGHFQKSISFRQSLQPPCALPLSDPLNFCIPKEGEITTSPLRVAAVGQSAAGVSWLQVWVDGVKYWTEHDAGTADMKMMNNYVYLPTGNHEVTMVMKESDGTSIKKVVNVQIVANNP
jgi:hypothetical protein